MGDSKRPRVLGNRPGSKGGALHRRKNICLDSGHRKKRLWAHSELTYRKHSSFIGRKEGGRLHRSRKLSGSSHQRKSKRQNPEAVKARKTGGIVLLRHGKKRTKREILDRSVEHPDLRIILLNRLKVTSPYLAK